MKTFSLRLFGLALFFFLAAGLAFIQAATRTWDGTSGNWTDDAKWGGTRPQNGDTATLPSGTYTVTLATDTANLTAYTQNGGTLLFTNWTTALKAGEVQILTGTVTHALCDTNIAPGNTNRVWIIATNVTVGTGASINVSSAGYRGANPVVSNYVGQGLGGGIGYGAGQVSVSAVHPDTGEATMPASVVEVIMSVIINRGAIISLH